MYFLEFFLLTGLVSMCTSSPGKNIVLTLHQARIYPDLIDYYPRKTMTIEFVETQTKVDLGNELKPSQVQNIPFIDYPVGLNEEFYTLIFIDPDAPSSRNPFERSFVHWLVGNIPQAHVDFGDTLAEFLGSRPPPDSGEHRYAFFVYKQPNKIQFNETGVFATFEGRKYFSLKGFTEKYNLGKPYAGNFYVAFPES